MPIKLEDLQEYALKRGGKLLSSIFVNHRLLLEWGCVKGHTWAACWSAVKYNKSWCPTCAGQSKPSIEILRQYAICKGGRLLSTEYVNSKTRLQWECIEHHQWLATWDTINNKKTWCPKCSKVLPPSIEEMSQFAIKKSGKLISNCYKTARLPLVWECNKGHQWEASWSNINHKTSPTWCPTCFCKSEDVCRNILELRFNIKFKRKCVLINGSRRIFDGYNEDAKIAFEYNGYQHYVFPNRYHKTEEDFLLAQERDKEKEQYCRDNGIFLVVIPYTEENQLLEYITSLEILSNV